MKSDLEEAESQDCTTIFRTGDRCVFHNIHSKLVNLSQDKRTASCHLPKLYEEIVFSDQPLQDNEIFEVRIDDENVVENWSSIEIGT